MLQNKNFTKLISIILALFLWIYVVAVENPPTRLKVDKIPVKLVNVESLEERGLALSPDGEYFTEVVVEGARADVIKLDEDDIEAKADIAGYKEGQNYVPIEIKLPPNVDLVEQRLQKVAVNIEKLVVSEKPLGIVFVGEIPEDEEAVSFDTKPREVFVRGAASTVSKVFILRAELPATKLSYEKQYLQAKIKALDAAGQEVEGIEISASKVMIEVAKHIVKDVKLDVEVKGEVDPKYQVVGLRIPDTVKVKGLKADVERLDRLGSSDVDISGVTSNARIPIVVKLPRDVTVVEGMEPSLDITIRGVSSRELVVDKSLVAINGKTESKTVAFQDNEVKVKLVGPEQLIQNIKSTDIRLTLDISDLEAGNHQLRPKTELPSNISGIRLEAEPVSISISKEE